MPTPTDPLVDTLRSLMPNILPEPRTQKRSARPGPHLQVKSGSVLVPVYRCASGRRTRYFICYYCGGRRIRRGFSSLEDAKREAQIAGRQIAAGLEKATGLSLSEREAHDAAKSLLASTGIPLLAAVEEYVRSRELLGGHTVLAAVSDFAERHKGVRADALVPDLTKEFLESKRQDGASPATSAIWAAVGVVGIGGAITICAMLKFIGETAVVVMALSCELFTGVAVMSCVGGMICCCTGGAATACSAPTNPSSPPPSKSGGSCAAWKRTVPPNSGDKDDVDEHRDRELAGVAEFRGEAFDNRRGICHGGEALECEIPRGTSGVGGIGKIVISAGVRVRLIVVMFVPRDSKSVAIVGLRTWQA